MEAFLRKRKMYIFLFILLLKERIARRSGPRQYLLRLLDKRLIPVKPIPSSTMLSR